MVHYNLSQEEIKILKSHHSVEDVDAALEELSEFKSLDGLSIVEVPSNILPSDKVCVGRYNFIYISEQIGNQLFLN